MSVSPAQIRQRVAAAILDGATTPDWHESPLAYPAWPGNSEEEGAADHGDFCVGILPGTTFPSEDRQRRSGVGVGTVATTIVAVAFAMRIRPDAQVEDYDAALDAEMQLIGLVRVPLEGMAVRVVGAPVRGNRDWPVYLGEVRFQVGHIYPLD